MGLCRALGLLGAMAFGQALACNPDAPVPPIMENQGYDRIAMDFLIDDVETIAVGRFVGRLDVLVEGASSENFPSFVFELTDGWKAVAPRRQVFGGYWIPCQLEPQVGNHYIIYLTAGRPFHLLSAREADSEFEALGEFDWFYDQRGQLIRPDLVNEVGESASPGEASGE
ncbi:MAG: hypothetical protein ACR2QU_11290 [Gammaproteobacteria bacterium]